MYVYLTTDSTYIEIKSSQKIKIRSQKNLEAKKIKSSLLKGVAGWFS